ncbi:MAG TPA: molybdenum cofactor guanylyltransferase [Candidatus Dormibacteraeota bacterium]|jgi:molybdopterin-guanine dinucleotide biosynthesis protein A|nr:molybdenum cofactor guanylyltransferase [Candidatus Dormibacteraeota bacterium]
MSDEQCSEAALGALGYVLVGGASSRFGKDKAFAELGGRPMYARMMDVLIGSGIRGTGCLVGDPNKYGGLGVGFIPDLWPGEGPLGGIATALAYNESVDEAGYNIILSCDMPFLTSEWIEYLLDRARKGKAQVTLPQSAHGLEPLCAVWHTNVAFEVKKQFKRGVRKVTEALKQFEVEVLDEKDWKRFDTSGRLFWNMNTLADYEEARRAIAAENS